MNNVCKPAVRLAARLPPIAAKTPVMVVPILEPNTNGSAADIDIAPASTNFCTTPMVAAEP